MHRRLDAGLGMGVPNPRSENKEAGGAFVRLAESAREDNIDARSPGSIDRR
jgi:hypothetical protein